jgi:hypothetical protein
MTTKISSSNYNEHSFTNCKFDQQLVGKSIKGSKIKLKWEFEFRGKKNYVELFDSKLSGKRKIMANGHIILAPQV